MTTKDKQAIVRISLRNIVLDPSNDAEKKFKKLIPKKKLK